MCVKKEGNAKEVWQYLGVEDMVDRAQSVDYVGEATLEFLLNYQDTYCGVGTSKLW